MGVNGGNKEGLLERTGMLARTGSIGALAGSTTELNQQLTLA